MNVLDLYAIFIKTIRTANMDRELGGIRVLLSCSAALMPAAQREVRTYGGEAIAFALIELVSNFDAAATLHDLTTYDWIALTSPSAVRSCRDIFERDGFDLATLPKIMVTGRKTAAELRAWGREADFVPSFDFSSEGILAEFATHSAEAKLKILRCISSEAPATLSDGLRSQGHQIDDLILYHNRAISHSELPDAEAIFFASASAVNSFVDQFSSAALNTMCVVSIGKPCSARLRAHGIEPDLQAAEATVEASIAALANHYCSKADKQLNKRSS